MDRSSTPLHIRRRSQYIQALTYALLDRLREAFPGELLFPSVSSGKLLCVFSPRLKEQKLCAFLDKLQRQVFASTDGRITFYYATCTAVCIPADKFQTDTMVHAAGVLSARLAREKLCCVNLLDTDMAAECDPLLREETLVPDCPNTVMAEMQDQVAVKLDLDNLGAFFKDIHAYDRRDLVSRMLDQRIGECLDADPRILRIFSGGDDIFFLCPAKQYLSVVSQFHQKLHRILVNDQDLRDYGRSHFGLSGGICLIRKNFCPTLLTYWEQSEEALHIAKSRGGKNCLCVRLPDRQTRIIGWQDLDILTEAHALSAPTLFTNRKISADQMTDPLWLTQEITAWCKLAYPKGSPKEMKDLARIHIL